LEVAAVKSVFSELHQAFRFCPGCGVPAPSAAAARVFVCPACGWCVYANVAAAVVALIRVGEDGLVMVRRAREPFRGTLDLPGGFVEPGESAEEALRREVREEIGLDLNKLSYFGTFPNVYPYQGIRYRTLDLAFQAQAPADPILVAADDVDGVAVHPLGRLPLEAVGLASIRAILCKAARHWSVSRLDR
jgi:mutator protein MutT